MRDRGERLIGWARSLDSGPAEKPMQRPSPKPAAGSATAALFGNRDRDASPGPYAVYARRILGLTPLDGLLARPGAAERGTALPRNHAPLRRVAASIRTTGEAQETPLDIGRACFVEAGLPPDVDGRLVAAVRGPGRRNCRVGAPRPCRRPVAAFRRARDCHGGGRAPASPLPAAPTGSTCGSRRGPTSSTSRPVRRRRRRQAHTLLAPQLALEAALLKRGAFALRRSARACRTGIRPLPGRGESRGGVDPEVRQREERIGSGRRGWIASHSSWRITACRKRGICRGPCLSARRDMDGDYDHLARVLEWSAGARRGGRRGWRMRRHCCPSRDETEASQARASDPASSVWVSANAGSGKTHVLAQRVIRLLLGGTDPSKILCLTYTRAAAANMANRVFDNLAALGDAGRGALASELADRRGQAAGRRQAGAGPAAFCARAGDARRVEDPDDPRLLRGAASSVSARSQHCRPFRNARPPMEAALVAQARRDMIGGAAGAGDPELAEAFADVLERGGEFGLDALLSEIVAKRDRLRSFLDQCRNGRSALCRSLARLRLRRRRYFEFDRRGGSGRPRFSASSSAAPSSPAPRRRESRRPNNSAAICARCLRDPGSRCA